MKRVAIIGAGLSGLVLAHRLKSCARVALFEKSGGVGGRMATRHAGSFHFDHGAQYFFVKTVEFREFLQPFLGSNAVSRWDADFAELDQGATVSQRRWDETFPHYVAVPGMNHLAKCLAANLDVCLQTPVAKIEANARGWKLLSETNEPLGTYDWVVSTVPPAQAARLLPSCFSHVDSLSKTKMVGCYALMLGMRKPLKTPWQAALVRQADISWVSVNHSKPGRTEDYSLVAHATNRWSEAHIEEAIEDVKDHLTRELSQILGCNVSTAEYRMVHRWRYANIERQNGPSMYLDEGSSLAACGDWCIQGRVEAAFTSANRLSVELKPLIQTISQMS